MLIYNKISGQVIAQISSDQTLDTYGYHFPAEMKESLGVIHTDYILENHKYYKVIEGQVARMSEQEKQEVSLYSRILTEDERVLNKLKPSHEEIQKAEETLKLLELLQEVM